MRPTDSRTRLAAVRLSALLLRWYARHGRDLPWRRTRDPYAVLVSEVMLQQTQVSRVVPAYGRFLARFPTLDALAQSELAAGDLALVIGRSASATSQHLRVLRDAGVVMSARRGNIVRYRLANGFSPEMIASFAMQIDAA